MTRYCVSVPLRGDPTSLVHVMPSVDVRTWNWLVPPICTHWTTVSGANRTMSHASSLAHAEHCGCHALEASALRAAAQVMSGGGGGLGSVGRIRAATSEQTSRLASHSVFTPAERLNVLLLPQQW